MCLKMSINIFSEEDTTTDNTLRYTTKIQNDIDYLNTTGDTLTGDLNLNGNKLYLNNNKKQLIKNSDDIVFETDDKFIVKNNSNNTLKFYIDNDKIHCNSKRLVSVLHPTDENNAANKKYVDSKLASTTFDNLTLRYLKYKFIKDNFQPTFWVSDYFNRGLKVMDNLDLTSINNSSHTITEITKSGSTNSGKFTYSRLIENTALTNIILRLDGANRITSVVMYYTLGHF